MKKLFTALVLGLAVFGASLSAAAATTTPETLTQWQQALNKRLELPSVPPTGSAAPQTEAAETTTTSSTSQKTCDLSKKKIYMYGDSYTVRAMSTLEKTFPNLNAQGVAGISYPAAAEWFKTGVPKEAEVVVYALGTNVPETVNIDEAMQAAGDRPVFWVNCYTLNIAASSWQVLADKLTAATAKYPNLTVVDWRATAQAHPELFDTDGIHPSPNDGIKTWVQLLDEALVHSKKTK